MNFSSHHQNPFSSTNKKLQNDHQSYQSSLIEPIDKTVQPMDKFDLKSFDSHDLAGKNSDKGDFEWNVQVSSEDIEYDQALKIRKQMYNRKKNTAYQKITLFLSTRNLTIKTRKQCLQDDSSSKNNTASAETMNRITSPDLLIIIPSYNSINYNNNSVNHNYKGRNYFSFQNTSNISQNTLTAKDNFSRIDSIENQWDDDIDSELDAETAREGSVVSMPLQFKQIPNLASPFKVLRVFDQDPTIKQVHPKYQSSDRLTFQLPSQGDRTTKNSKCGEFSMAVAARKQNVYQKSKFYYLSKQNSLKSEDNSQQDSQKRASPSKQKDKFPKLDNQQNYEFDDYYSLSRVSNIK